MILANITSYLGQCADAEHYYCYYVEVEESNPPKQCESWYSNKKELKNILTQEDAVHLNKKDSWKGWEEGMETNRFNSIEQINSKLIELLGQSHTIVSYYENHLSSESLYWKAGVNLGVAGFGEVWNYIPSSFYTDLLKEKEKMMIKCENCGTIFNLDDISFEYKGHGRAWTKFEKKRDIDQCCDNMELIWNVIL